MWGLTEMGPKPQKMVGEGFVCNQFADIGEGKTGPSLDDMAALGVRRDPVGVNPGQGGGEQAEMEVVGDGIGGPVLAAGAPDFLFDFFEAGFDFPAGTIVFDDLGDGEGQVGGEESHPLGFAKDPDHPHRAAQGFEYEDLIIGAYFPRFAIKLDRVHLRPLPQRRRQLGHRTATIPIFAGPTLGGPGRIRWFCIQDGTTPQAGQQVDGRHRCAQGLPQAVIPEPAVADDQRRVAAEMSSHLQDHGRSLGHFRLKDRHLPMTTDVDLAGLNVLLPMVEATGHRQAGPAALDGLEQAEHDDILCPGISGMIHLGGMIEEKAAAEDPLAGFVVEGVIEGQDQAPIDQRGRNQIPGNRPEAIPGQLGGGHEEVEAAGVHIQTE